VPDDPRETRSKRGSFEESNHSRKLCLEDGLFIFDLHEIANKRHCTTVHLSIGEALSRDLVTPHRIVITTRAAGAKYRIRKYPNLHFIVIINPNSGPGGKPDLPDEHYQSSVPKFQGYSNVTLLGYVHTSYGKRKLKAVTNDVDTYWRWHELSLTSVSGPMGLDGIFLDEISSGGEELEYFGTLSRYIRKKRWRYRKPGKSDIGRPNV
jgi:hypothetical protein